MSTATQHLGSPETTKHAPSAGPIQCAPWCRQGDGHPEVPFLDDQYCLSVEGVVLASFEEPTLWCDGTIRPAYAMVYAEKPAAGPARVTLVDVNDRGMYLTPHEARDLASQLQHFAWVADHAAADASVVSA